MDGYEQQRVDVYQIVRTANQVAVSELDLVSRRARMLLTLCQ